jgi:hypothetical protein
MQTYTLYFSKESLGLFDSVKPYDYMDDSSSPAVFKQALYPIFNYYKKRTSKIEVDAVNENTTHLQEGDLLIETTASSLKLFLQKILAKKNILLIDEREALLDVERTWKIITASKDLHTYKRVLLCSKDWTKMVYAYRLCNAYNLQIVDITKK